MVGIGALWVSKKEIPSIQIVLPKTQKETSEQKVLELENQILELKFGNKITEFTIIKKITTPNLESCPGVKDYTQNKVWFSEGFPDIKGFRDYAIEGFIGINGEFICLYANRRGAGSGSPPLIPIDSFYDQVTTADWKTYNNAGHKYEIKYPEGWILSEFCEGIPGEASFCDFKKAGFSSKETYDKISNKYASITNGIPNDDDINIWVVLKSSRQSLRDYVIYLSTKIEHYNVDQLKIEEKKTNKGIDFLLYTNPTITTHQTAFFEKDNTVYKIESHADTPNSETKSKVFNQMLSTFKFLE